MSGAKCCGGGECRLAVGSAERGMHTGTTGSSGAYGGGRSSLERKSHGMWGQSGTELPSLGSRLHRPEGSQTRPLEVTSALRAVRPLSSLCSDSAVASSVTFFMSLPLHKHDFLWRLDPDELSCYCVVLIGSQAVSLDRTCFREENNGFVFNDKSRTSQSFECQIKRLSCLTL